MATCHDCKTDFPFSLDKHHVIPRGMPGADEATNLIDVCPNCHRARHTGPNADSIPWVRAHTPEASAKRKQSNKEKWQDPDYRARVLAAQAAARTPEVQARRTASVQAWYADEDNRERVAAIVRANSQSPEHAEKIRLAHREGRLKPPPPGDAARMAHARTFLPLGNRPPDNSQISAANEKRSETMKRRWAEGAFAGRAQGQQSKAIKQAWADGRYADRKPRTRKPS